MQWGVVVLSVATLYTSFFLLRVVFGIVDHGLHEINHELNLTTRNVQFIYLYTQRTTP